jgi:hypothetical protein
MRRRFAGEVLGGQNVSTDALTAATDALKQAQLSAKGARGGRLGPGSQLEREEGEKAAPILAAAKAAETPKAPAVDIAGMRSALGIDQLMASIRGLQSLGEQTEANKFEFPTFEMPQFEMPDFQLPDFGELLKQYLPKTETTTEADTTTTATTTPAAVATTPAAKKNVVKIAGTSINLAKYGGTGFGTADIKALEKKGFSTQQIIKAASQSTTAPTAAAQKALNIKTVANPEGGFTVQKQSQKAKEQPKTNVVLASPNAVQNAIKTPTQSNQPQPQPQPRPQPQPQPQPQPKPQSQSKAQDQPKQQSQSPSGSGKGKNK